MLASPNAVAKPAQTPGYTLTIVHGGGNGVTYRAVVRCGDEVIGWGGACKTPYAAQASGEKLAAKHAVKAVAGYNPGVKASAPTSK